MLRVLVSDRGRPEKVDVQTSSGFARLDEAARQAAMRAMFKPHLEDGRPVAVYALMRLGAVLVPINTRLTQAEIDWQVADAEIGATLTDASALLEAVPAERTQREFDLSAPHSIIYTSGTSGRPKGAILTYANHYWSAVASALNLGTLPDDRWLACMPLSGFLVCSAVLLGFALGGGSCGFSCDRWAATITVANTISVSTPTALPASWPSFWRSRS